MMLIDPTIQIGLIDLSNEIFEFQSQHGVVTRVMAMIVRRGLVLTVPCVVVWFMQCLVLEDKEVSQHEQQGMACRLIAELMQI